MDDKNHAGVFGSYFNRRFFENCMLNISDLKVGTYFTLDGEPYQVLESNHLKKNRSKAILQTRIKNLITGKIFDRNFQQSDTFEEAEIENHQVKFLYSHRGEFWFSEIDNPSKRFKLDEDTIGNSSRFFKPNTIVESLLYNRNIIDINLPVKMDFRVTEAPPATKGNTAQGGTKQVTIETGAKVIAPLFINQGDIIRINTRSGEYVERAEKK